MENTKITTNHNEIKAWAEARNGRPQIIEHGDASGSIIGIRIDFPGKLDERYAIETLESNTSWDRFFEIFNAQNLAFEYSDEKPKRDNVMHEPDYSSLYRFIKRNLA